MIGCLNEFIKEYLLMLANNPDNRKTSLVNHRNMLEMIEKKDIDNAWEDNPQTPESDV